MQLLLIVQLSIAMLAGELSGTCAIGFAWSVGFALFGPVLALVGGVLVAARADRHMQHGDACAVDRMYAQLARLRLVATLSLLIAALGDLSPSVRDAQEAASVRFGGAGLFLLACGLAAIIATIFAAYPVERRIREALLIRQLDGGRTVPSAETRLAWVIAQLRVSVLPLLVPLVVPLLGGEIARALAMQFAPRQEDLWQVIGAAIGAVLLFLLVPILVPFLLGLRRMAVGEMRSDLEALSKDAGVPVGEIWVWPTGGLIANAAVMGVFPRLRCVMLTDVLLECMPRDQVLAVMAHELGHVKRRHLTWLIVVVLACWTLAGMLVDPLVRASFESLSAEFARSAGDTPHGLGDGEADAQIQLLQFSMLARDGCILALGLFFFGWVSRRFERQADTFAVQILSARSGRRDATPESVEAMVGALGSVAWLNHVPRDRSSWRHGSIQWRQNYLHTLRGRAHDGVWVDQLVALLKWISCALVVSAVLMTVVWDGVTL